MVTFDFDCSAHSDRGVYTMTRTSAPRFLWWTVLVVAVILLFSHNQSWAQTHNVECAAVYSKATITLPNKLILGVFEDSNQKKCDFVVSMPPSQGTKTVSQAWFELKASDAIDPKAGTQIIADLAKSLMSERFKEFEKPILIEISNGSKITSACIGALFKKNPIEVKSESGRYTCSVPATADHALLRISASNTLTLLIVLPRPA